MPTNMVGGVNPLAAGIVQQSNEGVTQTINTQSQLVGRAISEALNRIAQFKSVQAELNSRQNIANQQSISEGFRTIMHGKIANQEAAQRAGQLELGREQLTEEARFHTGELKVRGEEAATRKAIAEAESKRHEEALSLDRSRLGLEQFRMGQEFGGLPGLVPGLGSEPMSLGPVAPTGQQPSFQGKFGGIRGAELGLAERRVAADEASGKRAEEHQTEMEAAQKDEKVRTNFQGAMKDQDYVTAVKTYPLLERPSGADRRAYDAAQTALKTVTPSLIDSFQPDVLADGKTDLTKTSTRANDYVKMIESSNMTDAEKMMRKNTMAEKYLRSLPVLGKKPGTIIGNSVRIHDSSGQPSEEAKQLASSIELYNNHLQTGGASKYYVPAIRTNDVANEHIWNKMVPVDKTEYQEFITRLRAGRSLGAAH